MSESDILDCLLCKGEKIPAEGFSGNRIHTMKQNLDFLFGPIGNEDPSDYIQLVEDEDETYLTFNNSSGEYSDGIVAIQYCPLCGRKLKSLKEETE